MNATPTVAATHTVPGSMNATPTFGAGCIPFDEGVAIYPYYPGLHMYPPFPPMYSYIPPDAVYPEGGKYPNMQLPLPTSTKRKKLQQLIPLFQFNYFLHGLLFEI